MHYCALIVVGTLVFMFMYIYFPILYLSYSNGVCTKTGNGGTEKRRKSLLQRHKKLKNLTTIKRRKRRLRLLQPQNPNQPPLQPYLLPPPMI